MSIAHALSGTAVAERAAVFGDAPTPFASRCQCAGAGLHRGTPGPCHRLSTGNSPKENHDDETTACDLHDRSGRALVLGLGACSGMSQRDQNTAVGAGIGGVAGAVLTGGSAVGTVGGAVVGGVIGNQVDK